MDRALYSIEETRARLTDVMSWDEVRSSGNDQLKR
jgi:hypothetical protein